MARFYPLLSSFTSGEWASDMDGRVDIDKYFHAATCLLNYLVMPQGGVTRRPGTKYVAPVKNHNSKVVLLPMSVTAEKNYVLEVGAGYIRPYANSAQLLQTSGDPVEVTTPYAEADLFNIDRVPSVDVMYLLNAKYNPCKLERYSDTCFRFRTVTFKPPPTIEFGARPTANLLPSALTGDSITLTTVDGAAGFLDADCGREVHVVGGCNAGARAGISGFTCAGSVTANVCVPFLSLTRIDCGHWKITGSPQAALVVQSNDLTEGVDVPLTLITPGFRGHATKMFDTDCGHFIHANGGQIEITSVTSCTTARGIIRGQLSSATSCRGAWSMEESLWSALNGYPETGAFLDGRLYLASCHRFAGSKVGDYENFAVGTLSDDAVQVALDSDQLQTIRWLIGQNGLLIGTLSGEFRAVGGDDNPITPDNIHVEGHTRYGSNGVPPVPIGNSIIFVARSGRKIREFAPNPDTLEGFVAPDLLLLARHLTTRERVGGSDPTIVQMAYQQEPDSRLWAVRSDGVLLCCTYLRDQNVVAWSRHITEGSFESVCVIPHPDGDRDQVWVAVKRTINGATKRYVEYLDDAGVNYPITMVDCAYTCDRGSASTTITGLSHLECARVTVVGDGGAYPDQRVIGGNVTIDPSADKVEVGLPFDSVVTTMRPEIRTSIGTSQTSKLRWATLFVRVKDSVGLIAGTEKGLETIPFRSTCDLMGCAPSLFTGDKRLPHLGWDCGKVTLIQNLPLPSTILMISGTVDLGSG